MISKYNSENLTLADIKKNWGTHKQTIKLRLFHSGCYIPFFQKSIVNLDKNLTSNSRKSSGENLDQFQLLDDTQLFMAFLILDQESKRAYMNYLINDQIPGEFIDIQKQADFLDIQCQYTYRTPQDRYLSILVNKDKLEQ